MPKGKITDPEKLARLHAEWAKLPPISTHMTPRRRAQVAEGMRIMAMENMPPEVAQTDPELVGKPGVEGPKVDASITLPDLDLPDSPPEDGPFRRKPR